MTVLLAWSDLRPRPKPSRGAGLEAPQLLRAPQEAPGARAGTERRKTLATQIAGALMKGQPVILLGDAPAVLPENLRRLCGEALTLPRPGRALISAALALLYPEGGKEPSTYAPGRVLGASTELGSQVSKAKWEFNSSFIKLWQECGIEQINLSTYWKN